MPGNGLDDAMGVGPERPPESIAAFDPVIIEPSDIAHPVVVDVGIEPRRHAHELRPFGPLRLGFEPDRHVASLFALRADGVGGVRIVPRTGLESIVARGDRADRADVHEVARYERAHAFFLERRDLAAISPIDDVDLRVAVDVAHEPHAARTQDTALPIEHQRWSEIDVTLDTVTVEYPPGEFHAAVVGPERVGAVLQRTFAACVSHWTVERVIDEQEFEHAGARFDDLGRPRAD